MRLYGNLRPGGKLRILLLTAVVVAAITMTTPVYGANFKLHMCNARQPATVELSCAQRNIYHATFTLIWIRQEHSRTLQIVPIDVAKLLKLARLKVDMNWLLTESKRDKLEALGRLPLPYSGDFLTSVRLVQATWPMSAGWIVACSSSEGGHGGFVMNRGGSGAGGWMQYMEGTFYTDYDNAVTYAREHGLQLPPDGTRNWKNPFGQAYAAGYAFAHARPAGKWTGTTC